MGFESFYVESARAQYEVAKAALSKAKASFERAELEFNLARLKLEDAMDEHNEFSPYDQYKPRGERNL